MTAKEKFIEMSKDITRPGIDRLMGSRSVYPRHIADGGAVPRPVQSFHLYGEYAQC